MFYVTTTFWKINNRGTAQESRRLGEYAGEPQDSGPFETRASAEAFARGLATQELIAKVVIYESDVDDE